MPSTILMMGTFDTKEAEFAYLYDQIIQRGYEVLTVNVGVMASPLELKVDVDSNIVALAGGSNLEDLRNNKNRDIAMDVMCKGASSVILSLYQAGRFHGIIGMGGGGGTSIVTTAMRVLPLGIPKLCISTVASGDVSAYVGAKDIVMFPSLVDIAGTNRLLRVVIAQAAGAICGMVAAFAPLNHEIGKPVIAVTMFGNTTPCVQACAKQLRELGFEVIVFHATGTGGLIMETLIEDGYIDAVLDLTTTEIADEVCGGIMSSGESRLTAAARKGIPQVIAPGCLDMVNFGPTSSVPAHYQKERILYKWNPNNTLMRTNITENRIIGGRIAQRLNESQGPVVVLLPLRGISILDEDNQPFCDREADSALFDMLKRSLKHEINIMELDMAINNPDFATKAVDVILDLIHFKK